MVRPVIKIKPIPKDATPAERLKAFFEFCEENRRTSGFLLPPGVKKKWWQVFRMEHPFQNENTLTPKYLQKHPQYA